MPFDKYDRWIPPDDSWLTRHHLVAHKHGWRKATAEEIKTGKAKDKGGDSDSIYRGRLSWDQIFNLPKVSDDLWDKKGRGYDFKGLLRSGLIEDLFPRVYDDSKDGVDELKTLQAGMGINTAQWNKLDESQRFKVLRRYQDFYWGEDDITWSDDGKISVYEDGKKVGTTTTIKGIVDTDLRDDPSWGLDLQRQWKDEDKEKINQSTGEIFQQLMGLTSDGQKLNQYFKHGSKIDFKYYNKPSNKSLMAMKQYVFGEYYHQDYSTAAQMRDAWLEWNKISADERDRLEKWGEKFIIPYKDHELNADDEDAWEFKKSMEFDPETNTMTYYDPIAGYAKEDYAGNPVTHTIEPPAEPKVMDIRVGPTVQKLYDEDGNRIVNESSVNELYHRYLGRAADQKGLDYWMNEGHSFNAIENYFKQSPEGQANKAKWLDPNDKLYFNPQEYGSPESITARMRDEPAKIKAPAITIRHIGQPKKPANLPSHWLTEAPVKVPAVTREDATKNKITALGKTTLGASLGALL